MGQYQGPSDHCLGGLWSDNAKGGPVYSGIMTDANEAI